MLSPASAANPPSNTNYTKRPGQQPHKQTVNNLHTDAGSPQQTNSPHTPHPRTHHDQLETSPRPTHHRLPRPNHPLHLTPIHRKIDRLLPAGPALLIPQVLGRLSDQTALQGLLKQRDQQPLAGRDLDLASIKTLKQRIQRPERRSSSTASRPLATDTTSSSFIMHQSFQTKRRIHRPLKTPPRPLPGHDTPNTAHHTYTLKCEEPQIYNTNGTNYCRCGLKYAIMAP